MNQKDTSFYLGKMQATIDKLDAVKTQEKQMVIESGEFLNSVAIKVRKNWWTNTSEKGNADIFFSVWINDDCIKSGKILYNIHAFKLRNLRGYNIQSREFASSFRARFKTYRSSWPNVSTEFGPLTLMQGWQATDVGNFEITVAQLISMFISQSHIIDESLAARKKQPNHVFRNSLS